jgi:hypothetical protein
MTASNVSSSLMFTNSPILGLRPRTKRSFISSSVMFGISKQIIRNSCAYACTDVVCRSAASRSLAWRTLLIGRNNPCILALNDSQVRYGNVAGSTLDSLAWRHHIAALPVRKLPAILTLLDSLLGNSRIYWNTLKSHSSTSVVPS